MVSKKINGYTIELAQPHPQIESRFITITDMQGNRHQFNMFKPDGKWVIRNPLTVPTFVVQLEEELSKLL